MRCGGSLEFGIEFYLTVLFVFYEDVVSVQKKLVSLQRHYIWGSSKRITNMVWVKQEDVCKTKTEDGLGMKDFRLVNFVLLSKWMWRIHLDSPLLWRDISKITYGAQGYESPLIGKEGCLKKVSRWWINVSLLGSPSVQELDWFASSFVKVVVDGQKTRFWHDVWVEITSICVYFERLFLISEQKSQVMGSLGSWVVDIQVWSFMWIQTFRVFEEEILISSLDLILGS